MNTIHPHSALLGLLLLLLLLLLPSHAVAAPAAGSFEQRCEREMLPSIAVHAHHPGFVVHNTISGRVLSNRSESISAGQLMMGMTSSHTRAEVSIEGPSLTELAGDRECVAPRIEVDLSYQPLDIYVAREFHPASCAYREVFAHELQHVKIYADQLPTIERVVREELVKRYGGRPLYAPRGTGLSTLQDQIDSWLPTLIRGELAKVETKQNALDSRLETDRLSHLCQGEVAAMMGSSF
ncbi:MAG TPA: hypothetical protein VFS02_16875 [Telluria sp.]|nr:hypothetical protein [Telluria sp.]